MFEQITSNLWVYYSPNSGSNAFLLLGKKAVLIDASNEGNAAALARGLAKAGIAPDEIDLLLLTHGHADHFSGAKQFSKAEVRMHKLDADYVNSRDRMYTAAELLGTAHFPKIKHFLSTEKPIKFHPFTLEVLLAPGHTQGSVCFFERHQKLLFSGDLLFNEGVGRYDLLSGDKEQLVSSLHKLKGLNFGMLLPGHGLVLREKQKENIDYCLKTLSAASI